MEQIMKKSVSAYSLVVAGLVAAVSPIALAAHAAEAPIPAAEAPLAPEHNPPGDIPDNQVFIDYASPLGFSLKVPEGWARHDLKTGAVFTDKYDGVAVTEGAAKAAPSKASARQDLAPQIAANARAVTITKIEEVKLPAGSAVCISYGSNSDPNPVTNKAIRLENDRYYFWKDGKLVSLDLSAPWGADNVDQWTMMAHSFRWQ
jgi:hypothetical protein